MYVADCNLKCYRKFNWEKVAPEIDSKTYFSVGIVKTVHT